jgi:predicted dehydrogenase
MTKVRLGFLGCGFMGQLAHLQNYAALDTCEVAGVTDVKQKQAELVAARYGVPKVYASAAELLADPSVDAVVASQPFDNHVNIVCGVLNAGKHILTEKPLCVFAENGNKLVECASKNKRIHMIANHKRSDPAVEYAMKTINGWKASGEMGKMRYVRLTMPPGDWIGGAAGANLPIRTDEPYAAYTPEAAPPGLSEADAKRHVAFVNYYIHQVNLMRHLLGEDYALAYAGKSGVLLATESVSGIAGVIEMSAFTTSDTWQETAMVCFEKGYINIRLFAPLASQRAGEVTVFTDNGGGGVFTSPALPNVSAMRNQAANFIKAVKGEIEPPCSSAEALKDLVFAAAYIQAVK